MDAALTIVQLGLLIICVVCGTLGIVLFIRSKRYPRARRREIRCGSCPMWRVMEMDYGQCELTGDVKYACRRACAVERKRRLRMATRQMTLSEYATRSYNKALCVSEILEQMDITHEISYRTNPYVFTLLANARDLRTIHGYLRSITRRRLYGESPEDAQKLNPQIDFGA